MAIGFLLLIVTGIFGVAINIGEDELEFEEKVYSGPVPEGYDLEHFRSTGETILLEE